MEVVKFRYYLLINIFFCLVLSLVNSPIFGQSHSISIKGKNIQRYLIPCNNCKTPLEISGLTRYKNYLFILPQTQNYLYVSDLEKQNSGSILELTKVPFLYKKTPTGSEGWEAITYREITEDSLEIYLGLEKCRNDIYCLLKAPVKVNTGPKSVTPIEIGPLTSYNNQIKSSGNLSYEAIMWVERPEFKGILIIPEKITDHNLATKIVTESGKQIKITPDSSLFHLRISDMTAHPTQTDAFLASSFCWKGNNRDYLNGNTWCFEHNDSWKSKLSLVTLQLRQDEHEQLKLHVISQVELDKKFIKVNGPDPNKMHEYNAEGLAVDKSGELILVNDNSPDGANTELRILPGDILIKNYR